MTRPGGAGDAGALGGSPKRSACWSHGRRAPAGLFDDHSQGESVDTNRVIEAP